jgi:hypothetical protein
MIGLGDVRKESRGLEENLPAFPSGNLSVVEEVLNKSILSSSVLDRLERADDVSETARTGSTSDGEDSELVALGVDQVGKVEAVSDFTSVIPKDGDVARIFQWQSVVDVLQEDRSGAGEFADEFGMVVTDVNVRWAVGEVVTVGRLFPRALGSWRAAVDGGDIRVLFQAEITGHDSEAHIVQTADIKTAIVDAGGQVLAPEGRDRVVKINTARHVHVEAGVCCVVSSVSGEPVTDDVTLESELILENAIQNLGVLTPIGAVQPIPDHQRMPGIFPD